MSKAYETNLDAPLLQLSPSDSLTLRDAHAGTHVLGATGSGKTSATGRAMATAFLRAGMGGLVHCIKPDEVDSWITLARDNGRLNSLVIFDDSRHYNFIDHLLAKHGADGVGTVIDAVMRILEASNHATGNVGSNGDAFWLDSVRMVLANLVPVLHAATGTVTIPRIVEFLASAGTTAEAYMNEDWAKGSFAAKTLTRLVDNPAVPPPKEARDAWLEYWLCTWPGTPDKTRGNISVSVASKLDRFRHGRMRSMFCSDRTDVLPEMCLSGSIILLALPVLTWGDDGVVGQILMKYMWQKTVEARNSLLPRYRDRSLFLYADEAQYVVNSYDQAFLSTCRSSRTCVVYMTQNIPTYLSRMGKDKEADAESLIGTFGTQVFHANSCAKTNEFASKLVGKAPQWRASHGSSEGTSRNRGLNEGTNASVGSSSNQGMSHGQGASFNHGGGTNEGRGSNHGVNVGQGTNESRNWSEAEQNDFILEPRYFAANLKTGGPANGNKVSAVFFRAGARFVATASNILFPTFRQK